MEFISSNVTILDSYTYRSEWVFEIQWAFDDQDWIHILCEAIEVDGFSLGPGHAYIGGSNHQAMENDLEIAKRISCEMTRAIWIIEVWNEF